MVSLVVCVLLSLNSNGVLRVRGLTSHGVLRCLCPDAPEVARRLRVSFVVCVLLALRSNGVLRLCVMTSPGVLGCLCPDDPEVQWRPSFCRPDV